MRKSGIFPILELDILQLGQLVILYK